MFSIVHNLPGLKRSCVTVVGCARAMSLSSFDAKVESFIEKCDPTQASYLEKENCILVDHNDKCIGFESKKNCHLLANIEKGMLHRAFSVFLFDNKLRLLLQKRSDQKITYPNLWTNTCCSHPLSVPAEISEDNMIGIRRAAKRRLKLEFGIDVPDVDLFKFLTRIHYKADNMPHDGLFGEHEIDYIFFVRGDFSVNPSSNEIKEYRFVTQEELKQMLDEQDAKPGGQFTPWFNHIARFLFEWWSNYDHLEKFVDSRTIHRLSA